MKDIFIDSSSQDSGGGGSGPIPNDILVRAGLCGLTYRPSQLAQRETDANTSAVVKYLMAEPDAEEFRTLSALRRKGWESADGDKAFQEQRKRADNLSKDVSEFNYKLMGKIADELHTATGAFQMPLRACSVLDLCAAPGGFLNHAMRINPGCGAVGFSLHPDDGGYPNLLSPFRRRCMKYLDVTMLAEDMIGATDIPADHPDADKFLPRQIGENDRFDLVLCDGHILRTQDRSSGAGEKNEATGDDKNDATSDDKNDTTSENKNYRELYEIYRLKYVQLALGLEHLKPGGTMVILLHKVEMWTTLCTLRRLSCFSEQVRLHKPRVSHTTRSSFYLVATGVDSAHPEAVAAVAKWKAV
ncbi:hypothetical protein PG997_010870 [Apiospora hydei]|uniref:Ribosomal RNA methyltransferase FtsJ domain-containing protein n=1 Tax=Apiospora hydei TaxID=1337664 RepID=A0ABR1VHH8_9PEZI